MAMTLALVLISENASVELRTAAVTALDQFGADARVAIPALIKAVEDRDRGVRCLAMQTLGRLSKELGEYQQQTEKKARRRTHARSN